MLELFFAHDSRRLRASRKSFVSSVSITIGAEREGPPIEAVSCGDSLKIWEESRKSTIYSIELLESQAKKLSRKIGAGLGGSLRSRLSSTRLLASTYSCTQRAQDSLESLGSASNLLLLTGVGASLVLTYLSGMIIESSLSVGAELA